MLSTGEAGSSLGAGAAVRQAIQGSRLALMMIRGRDQFGKGQVVHALSPLECGDIVDLCRIAARPGGEGNRARDRGGSVEIGD